MTKSNVTRLLRAFIPFSIMVLFQRGLLLLFGYLNIPENLAELFAFVPAAAVCALAFSFTRSKEADEDGSDFIPPLKKQRKSAAVLMIAVAVSVMVAMMYAVTSILDGTLAEEVTLSPLTVISLVLIHPMIEEYVFRGLIYKEMRLMNPVFATLASAVMFAIVHNTVGGMLYALTSGIALAVLVELSGRLSASIAAHMIINARSLVYMTLLLENDGAISALDTMIFVLGTVSLVGVLVLIGRSPEPECATTADLEVDDEG